MLHRRRRYAVPLGSEERAPGVVSIAPVGTGSGRYVVPSGWFAPLWSPRAAGGRGFPLSRE